MTRLTIVPAFLLCQATAAKLFEAQHEGAQKLVRREAGSQQAEQEALGRLVQEPEGVFSGGGSNASNKTLYLQQAEDFRSQREHRQVEQKAGLQMEEASLVGTASQHHTLSPAGEDCPSHTFPVKSRTDCKQISRVILHGSDTLFVKPDPAMEDKNTWDDRPNGCYLLCEGPHCTAQFNEGGEAFGNSKIRRYCKEYFSSSAGSCWRPKTGERLVRARGTYANASACMLECLRGPLYSSWCEGFEASEPFTNECLFFESGYVGSGQIGTNCYARMPSSH
eukprot:TRINITY_DN27423_c0_g3_i1.p1 TRINITY_DN27423_c0_g3~~TRINITY_DN27423_c0_g3_i1.p1  ORF type:complete len:310 (+),score=48.60 TRINITY_DN27423_c0_g3_i1:94-930(+)